MITLTAPLPARQASEPHPDSNGHAGPTARDEIVYRVRGGTPLQGTVTVNGAKNAALPIIAATLLTEDPCVIENMPATADILVMLEVLRHLGAEAAFDAHGRLVVRAAQIRSRTTPEDLARRLRGSFLVMGPLLARFGQASAPRPGGCKIGARPIDVPVKGFSQLGAQVAAVDERFSASGRLTGANLVLDYPSHTGTENLIMAAVLADGITIIENASTEPEVYDLVAFLQSMGARIAWTGPATVAIQGVSRLHGTVYRLMPDRLEAGTYLIAAAITGGDIRVQRVVPRHLHAVTAKLEEAGATVEQGDHWVRVRVERPLAAVDIHTYLYPGFPTDLQQPFGALLTQASGESLVQETMFEDRLRYIDELARMGANVTRQGQIACIRGPSRLHGAEVWALDLRAGAAVVLAGLVADGETLVRDGQYIERGYCGFAETLQALGAHVVVERRADAA
ncbi:UDP-N-acetylglucosamine 1-carboxyvinyltransferase [bacterium]|nr:MAG: UDP-N-acetylglucosamine 1-carboxyvinyltransferase [bacterium]